MPGAIKKRRSSGGKKGNGKKQKNVNVCDDDVYYEAENVVDARKSKKGYWEYRVRWKGYKPSEDTWEPACNLNDMLLEVAEVCKQRILGAVPFDDRAVAKDQESKESDIFQDDDEEEIDGLPLGIKQDEKDEDSSPMEVSKVQEAPENEVAKANDPVSEAHDHWEWNDRELVNFREIERVDVNDPDARRRVTEARENGVPVCLVGHKGWAHFAKSWLKKRNEPLEKSVANANHSDNNSTNDGLDACVAAAINRSGLQSETSKAKGAVDTNCNSQQVPVDGRNSPMVIDLCSSSQSSPRVESAAFGNEDSPQPLPAPLMAMAKGTNHCNLRQAAMHGSTTNSELGSPNSKVKVTQTKVSCANDNETGGFEPTGAGPKHHINLDDPNSTLGTEVATDSSLISYKTIKKRGTEYETNVQQMQGSVVGSAATTSTSWLDLTEDWEVDVDRMINDVGNEKVPLVAPNYNELSPIDGYAPLAKFIRRCWPTQGAQKSFSHLKPSEKLYLHQWQFAVSPAAAKLCGPDCHNPLPNDIFGEDLLALWQDDNAVNPYQYIFMGRDETMSKLHKDPGGLEITIAPIVGEKEVVLVHRSDGYSCLSHLNASLEKIDLHNYPLVSQARIYKSVIKPGEILLMPQGTFHQCRNVTPCLSYSRFHLDTVNLRGFFESYVNGDAPEIEHESILWNCAVALWHHLDDYVDELRKSNRQEVCVPHEIVRKVDSLRALRLISRAVALRFENGGGGKLWRPKEAGFAEPSDFTSEEEALRWNKMLRELDSTLHDFQHRHKASSPPFRPRYYKSVQGCKTPKDNEFEKVLDCLPLVDDQDAYLVRNAQLDAGAVVDVNFRGRRVKGVVKIVEMAMHTSFLHFDGFADEYDEYIPTSCLKVPVAGETIADLNPKDAKPGMVVIYNQGMAEYWAVVKSCMMDAFVLLDLTIGTNKYERWLPRNSVLASIGNKTYSSHSRT